jgi:hypothetical protein
MKRAAVFLTTILVGCATAPPHNPSAAPLDPLTGMWAVFQDYGSSGKSWIGRSFQEQAFDDASLKALGRSVAQNAGIADAALAQGRIDSCLGNNRAVQFPQRSGAFEITNAGAVLNYSKDNHLTYFRVHTVDPPADLTPPALPADSEGFVMKAIHDRIVLSEGGTVTLVKLSDPFLYASDVRAVWAFTATLVTTEPDVSLPGNFDAVIDLATGRLLTFFDHAHAQNAPTANVFRRTPLSQCTHADYLTVSASPPYEEAQLLRLTPNAVTATGDYAIFVVLDPSIPHTPWACTDLHPGSCDFHFTWNDQPRQFSEVLAYYTITSVQLHVQNLGFQHLADRPIHVDVMTKLGPRLAVYNNNKTGTGDLWFSDDRKMHKVSRDPKVIVHEYGHALQATVLQTRIDQDGEPRALSEGFADYLALSTFAQNETDECRQCLAAFMNDGNCFRSLNDPHKPVPTYDRQHPGNNPKDRYDFGLIWTKALWLALDSVRSKLASASWDEARRIVDRGVLLGHCYAGPLATSDLTMQEVALATLAAVKDDSVTSPYLDHFCRGFVQQNILDSSACPTINNPPVLIP